MTAIPIFADLTNRKFVANSSGSSDAFFASPFHQDKLCLSVQALKIDPSGSRSAAPYAIVDCSGWAVTVLVTKIDGTVLAGPTVIATADGTAISGSIDLNTAAMVTAFTSSATLSIDAAIYIQFDDGSSNKTTIKGTFTILRSYITSGTPSELPLTSYMSRDEMLAMFVRWSGNAPGKAITLRDSTDTYDLILQCNSDGSNASDAG